MIHNVILSFRDREAKKIFDGSRSRRYNGLEHMIERKLQMLQQAGCLADLRNPPGNRLEALKGNRANQHSIRINDQYRICFQWKEPHAYEVEVVDYH